ncbi:hypothetical protein EHS17_09345 [Rhodobacteraceae bacterium CH30]|nr:hypothetical protein EHS17_09345 [Rhodobacteraceae bacterium CH30]
MSRRLVAGFMLAITLGLAACSENNPARLQGHWRAEKLKVQSLNIPLAPELIINEHNVRMPDMDMVFPVSSMSANGDEIVVDFPLGFGVSFYLENPDRMYVDVPLAGKVYYRRAENVDSPTPVSVASKPDSAASSKVSSQVLPEVKLAFVEGATASASTSVMVMEPSIAMAAPLGKHAKDEPSTVKRQDALALVREADKRLMDGLLFEAEALLIQAKRQNATHPMVDYHLAVLRAKQTDLDASVRHLNDAFKNGFRAISLLESNPALSTLKSDTRYQVLLAKYR